MGRSKKKKKKLVDLTYGLTYIYAYYNNYTVNKYYI